MPAITLPDGSIRHFDGPVTGTAIAASIGPGLAKAALVMVVDGAQKDLSESIGHDASLRFITRRDPEALDIIRHDAAHVLAEAVQALYPGTQVTIGPSIEHGFYYDFARNEPFTPEDFPAIEAKMREIVARNAPFEREVWPRAKAIEYFTNRGEAYKAELISDLPIDVPISIYRQGDWLDLCRGPHAPTTGAVFAEASLPVMPPCFASIRARLFSGMRDTWATRTRRGTREAALRGRSSASAKARPRTRSGLSGLSRWSRISRCRWGPVDVPVEPMRPTLSPAFKAAPGATPTAPMWA